MLSQIKRQPLDALQDDSQPTAATWTIGWGKGELLEHLEASFHRGTGQPGRLRLGPSPTPTSRARDAPEHGARTTYGSSISTIRAPFPPRSSL